jgi:hypothetical protein
MLSRGLQKGYVKLSSRVGSSGLPFPVGTVINGGAFVGVNIINGVSYAIICAPVADRSASITWRSTATAESTPPSYSNGFADTYSVLLNNTTYPAAGFCRTYSGGGFTDWFLPSLLEISLWGQAGRDGLLSATYFTGTLLTWSTQSIGTNAVGMQNNISTLFSVAKNGTAASAHPFRRFII